MESIWTQDCTLANAATIFNEPFKQVIESFEERREHTILGYRPLKIGGDLTVGGQSYRVTILADADGCVTHMTVQASGGVDP